MGRGTFRARAATAAALVAVAGCGGGAAATPTPTPIFGTSIPSPTGNPSGQEWRGTITSTSERQYLEPGSNHNTCSDAWTGTLSFSVNGQKAVTGSGALNLQGVVTCTIPIHSPPPPVQTYDVSVSGEETTGGFNLQFNITGLSPPRPAADIAGIASLPEASACPITAPGPKLAIPLDRPNHANGVVTLSTKVVQGCPGGSANDIFSSMSTIVLNGP